LTPKRSIEPYLFPCRL